MFRLIFLVIVFSYRRKEVDSCISAGTWRNVIDHRYEKIYKSTNITDVVPVSKSKEGFLDSIIKPTKDSKYFRNEGKQDNDSKVSVAAETGQTTSKVEISSYAEENTTTVATTTFKPNTLDDP